MSSAKSITDSYLLHSFNSNVREYGDKCHYCKTLNKLPEYNAFSMPYYRNKAGSDYYFCSKSCETLFKNKYICKTCHYNQDLIQPEGEEFVLCTDYPYELSCYDKYLRKKHPELVCSFCDSMKEEPLTKKGKNYYCDDCIHKIEEIKGTREKEEDCCFCYCDSSSMIVINGYTICFDCLEKYKKFMTTEDSKE